MSEIKPTTFKAIPTDALIDIQVSGSFYRQLTKLILALAESRPPEDFKKALETLKDKNPSDLYELNVSSVVAMIFEIEIKAKEQNKIEDVSMDPETGQITPLTTGS